MNEASEIYLHVLDYTRGIAYQYHRVFATKADLEKFMREDTLYDFFVTHGHRMSECEYMVSENPIVEA